ncbi:type VII secretion target [Nocardia jiangxiensis]|uniref:type VII secretion target n=1 Tax=Nocardia jiangxiensis TaxID=282685 RepID=UPI000311D772|nr:type VII secretion target [Nocardia jiangxiensis]
MPESSINVDMATLLWLAEQHRQVARDILEWSKQPTDWLDNFLPSYGTIAYPVYQALTNYYQVRENAGINLAGQHDHTADQLVNAARAYEYADGQGASNIRNAGGEQHDPTGTNQPMVPGAGPSTGGSTPVTDHSPVSASPNGATPVNGAGGPTSSDTPTGVGTLPAANAGGAPDDGAIGHSGPTGPTGPTAPDSATATPSLTGPMSNGPAGSLLSGGSVFAPGDDRGAGQPPSAADASPVPMPTPFAAAVSAARERDAQPSYVVGEQVDNDLVVAKALLGAVLAAVDSSVLGLHWSVAVMRSSSGAGVFITSNEGRGWFPAGLFLPREVSTPWMWDEFLSADSGELGSPWEGISDPARVLAEFGLAWGAKAGARLTALASSGPIDSGLRTRFNDAAMADMVGPAYDVDLRVFTPDTADRLGLAGSAESLEQAAAVPDAQIAQRALELAVDAQAKVGIGAALPADAGGSRALRQRILEGLQSGREIPASWWAELREADDLLTAAMLPRRVDVSRVEPGDLRVDDEVAALRAIVFERRCNELVLLQAGEPSRQQLRDAVYAHDQIVKHPRFVEVPPAVSAAESERVATPVASPGRVVAPSVTAGPPPGVVSTATPPSVAPPVVAPPTPRPDVAQE